MAATDPALDEDRRRREREALLLLLALLVADTGAEAERLITAGIAGSVGLDVFLQQYRALLADAHSQAAYVGRRLGGVIVPTGALDQAYGQAEAQEQDPYVQGLAGDVAAGRVSDAQAANRARMYAERLVGTANGAWVATLPADVMLEWVLDPAAGHCPDCPRFAKEGPYSRDELPAMPGDGTSRCLSNCRCYLRTLDGSVGPRLDEVI